jgi:hypothetical protein
MLTEEEKRQLMKEIDDIDATLKKPIKVPSIKNDK